MLITPATSLPHVFELSYYANPTMAIFALEAVMGKDYYLAIKSMPIFVCLLLSCQGKSGNFFFVSPKSEGFFIFFYKMLIFMRAFKVMIILDGQVGNKFLLGGGLM